MSTVAFIRRMLEAGFTHDDALLAAEAFEATMPGDAQAERRRAKDRERKRLRNSAESAERAEPRPLPSSPQTPQQPTPTREDIYTRVREADGFDEFWSAYPDKTGKKAARKAWDAAMDKPNLPALLLAIDQYRLTKPPDRAWCHASTWLNQGRWADEPPAPTGTRNDRPDRHQAARSDARSVWADIIADRDGAGTGSPEPLRLTG